MTALRNSAGWFPAALGIVSVTGPDAVRFVDGFTTAAVSSLAEGQGTEGFFTDARGWVLALATILRTADGLLVVADRSLAAGLLGHLDHHHIRERLQLRDVSAASDAVLVAGPGEAAAIASLADAPPPLQPDAHVACRLAGLEARVVRIAGRGADGHLIAVPAGQGERLAAALATAGLPRGEAGTLDALRIEARYPSPSDIPAKTLPQELGRDARAISFTKGCYLGQETVARLDALGHVNRRLTAVVIDAADPPATPAAVRRGGAEVGMLTSACHSPLAGGPLGLGLLPVRDAAAVDLEVGGAAARVWSPATLGAR